MGKDTILPGTGETYRADEIKDKNDTNPVKYQIVKLAIGPDGTVFPLSHQDPMPTFNAELHEIIHELRIMNIHLSFITDLHPHPDESQ